MPLINFKTDFTSLRYGNDRPNGGSSTQPYVQFPIPGVNPPSVSNEALAFFDSYYETNRTSLDFPIRGGRIVEVGGFRYSTPSNEVDTIRIKNFLKDAPRGTIFVEKQKALQLTNPNTQVANSLQYTGASLLQTIGAGNAILPVTRTYNPNNTIAQVSVQGTGAHYNRQGVNPVIFQAPQSTYEYIVANSNTATQNRLAVLAQIKLRDSNSFLFGDLDILSNGIDFQTYNELNISPIQNQILSYTGGPGSNYGIGNTIIKRATSTVPAKVYSKISLNYDQLANQITRPGADPLLAQVQDFRDQLDPTLVARSDYFYKSLERRLSVGNPGVNGIPRINYTDVVAPAIDALNQQQLFYYNSTNGTPWSVGGEDTKDIIKFAFECIDNDAPDNAIALIFRAFLEGAIQDSNSAQYNTFKYLGRGETFRTYQGFDRSVNFTFKILVQTRSEMQPLYRKLNHLISQVYPDYSPVSNFMRGSVVKLTIGDYFYRVPGFLEDVNVTLNTDVGWEILLNETEEDDVMQAPFVITVNCSFKPIMDILPRRETYQQDYVPLIMNRDNYLNSTIPSNVPTVVETPREAAITQPQRNLTANTPTQLSSENAGAPKIAANPANQTPRVQKDQGGGNPKLAREGNKKQAVNQNAVIYKNGIPTANPYGFLGGYNGTRTTSVNTYPRTTGFGF
jgi:hypothetical protein